MLTWLGFDKEIRLCGGEPLFKFLFFRDNSGQNWLSTPFPQYQCWWGTCWDLTKFEKQHWIWGEGGLRCWISIADRGFDHDCLIFLKKKNISTAVRACHYGWIWVLCLFYNIKTLFHGLELCDKGSGGLGTSLEGMDGTLQPVNKTCSYLFKDLSTVML